MNTQSTILTSAVDRLADIKAQIAKLQAEEAELKQFLIDSGEPVITGSKHRATVALCDGRLVTDWCAIAMRFEPSRQLITAHTKVGEPFHTVRLSAHKTSK